MLRFYFDKRILIGFLLALAILSWLAASSYLITKALMRGNQVVARSLDILYNTQRILAGATSIELSQRGYSLTGNKEFLETYNRAAGEIVQHLQNLQQLTRDNMDLQQRIEALAKNIDELLRFSNATMKARENPETPQQAGAFPESKRLADHIRVSVADIERTENILLQTQHKAEEKELRKFNYTFVALLLTTGAILVAIFFRVNVNLKARIGTETRLSAALGKIRNLNQELEAFTYSVSHDLRAPLRSIDGYSKILLEDYFDKLDDEGRRVISVIMGNARRMGKLIDDLLDFARLGRSAPMSCTGINMDQLVSGVLQEQLEQERGRKIDITIDPLITAQGDPDMMRQVWENLLANAIKYTSKTPGARIAISSFESENEVCYRIADNGVGFDMKYGHKLFGVFQRLHKVQDFTGTGVGLAIVKRVIDRHKGRVWAEGKVNEGATFYFTIPNDNGKQ